MVVVASPSHVLFFLRCDVVSVPYGMGNLIGLRQPETVANRTIMGGPEDVPDWIKVERRFEVRRALWDMSLDKSIREASVRVSWISPRTCCGSADAPAIVSVPLLTVGCGLWWHRQKLRTNPVIQKTCPRYPTHLVSKWDHPASVYHWEKLGEVGVGSLGIWSDRSVGKKEFDFFCAHFTWTSYNLWLTSLVHGTPTPRLVSLRRCYSGFIPTNSGCFPENG